MASNVIGHLVVIKKKTGRDGSIYNITKDTCSFGRDLKCDIRIQNPKVSQNHASIRKEQSGKLLLAADSGYNATFINGKVVDGAAQLSDGDVITIAERRFRFHVPNDRILHTPKSKSGSTSKKNSRRGTPLRDRNAGAGTPSNTASPALAAPKSAQKRRKSASAKKVRTPASSAAGEQMRRRSVNFGSPLSPELFDKDLPPSTPLKRGASPKPISVKRMLTKSIRPILKCIPETQEAEHKQEDTTPASSEAQTPEQIRAPCPPKLDLDASTDREEEGELAEEDLIDLASPAPKTTPASAQKQRKAAPTPLRKQIKEGKQLNKVYKKGASTPLRREIKQGTQLNKVYKKPASTPLRQEIKQGKQLNKVYKKSLATPVRKQINEGITLNSVYKKGLATPVRQQIKEGVTLKPVTEDTDTPDDVVEQEQPEHAQAGVEHESTDEQQATFNAHEGNAQEEDEELAPKESTALRALATPVRKEIQQGKQLSKVYKKAASTPLRQEIKQGTQLNKVYKKSLATPVRKQIKEGVALKSMDACADEMEETKADGSDEAVTGAHTPRVKALATPVRKQIKEGKQLNKVYKKGAATPLRRQIEEGTTLKKVYKKGLATPVREQIKEGKQLNKVYKQGAATPLRRQIEEGTTLKKVYTKGLATPVREQIKEGKQLNKVYKQVATTPLRRQIEEGTTLKKVYKKGLATPVRQQIQEGVTLKPVDTGAKEMNCEEEREEQEVERVSVLPEKHALQDELEHEQVREDQSSDGGEAEEEKEEVGDGGQESSFEEDKAEEEADEDTSATLERKDIKEPTAFVPAAVCSRLGRGQRRKRFRPRGIRLVSVAPSVGHPLRRVNGSAPRRVTVSATAAQRILRRREKRLRYMRTRALPSELQQEVLSEAKLVAERPHALPSPVRRDLQQGVALNTLYKKSLNTPTRELVRRGVTLRPVAVEPPMLGDAHESEDHMELEQQVGEEKQQQQDEQQDEEQDEDHDEGQEKQGLPAMDVTEDDKQEVEEGQEQQQQLMEETAVDVAEEGQKTEKEEDQDEEAAEAQDVQEGHDQQQEAHKESSCDAVPAAQPAAAYEAASATYDAEGQQVEPPATKAGACATTDAKEDQGLDTVGPVAEEAAKEDDAAAETDEAATVAEDEGAETTGENQATADSTPNAAPAAAAGNDVDAVAEADTAASATDEVPTTPAKAAQEPACGGEEEDTAANGHAELEGIEPKTPEPTQAPPAIVTRSARKRMQTDKKLTPRHPEPERPNIKAMKVKELRAELEKRGLSTSGLKAELQHRLSVALEPSPRDAEEVRGPKFKLERRKLSVIPEREEEYEKEEEEEEEQGEAEKEQAACEEQADEDDATEQGQEQLTVDAEEEEEEEEEDDQEEDVEEEAANGLTEDEVMGMKVKELRAELSERELCTTGRKAELQTRLLGALQEQEGQGEEQDTADAEAGDGTAEEAHASDHDEQAEQSDEGASPASDSAGEKAEDEAADAEEVSDENEQEMQLSREQIMAMKVAELREVLSAVGANVRGRKAQLQERLLRFIDGAEHEAEDDAGSDDMSDHDPQQQQQQQQQPGEAEEGEDATDEEEAETTSKRKRRARRGRSRAKKSKTATFTAATDDKFSPPATRQRSKSTTSRKTRKGVKQQAEGVAPSNKRAKRSSRSRR